MRIGVCGALGRMGRAVIELASDRCDLEIAALFDRPGSEGREVGGRALAGRTAAVEACEVIVDFSVAAASVDLAAEAARRGGPALVIGSTGFSPGEISALEAAARQIAIVKSGNFSLGINLLADLVEQAARRLEAEAWDIEIFEAHHRAKRDAPSGTAVGLGEAAARGRGADLAQLRSRPREGASGERAAGEIGFSVIRAGTIVGEHSVVFAGAEEILTLSHSARDRRLFARGALRAALWLAGRPPGLYGMKDVLDLEGGSGRAG
ncbi:MAG: 4-hydroxy-tetrahydrodipicolinate reductase [Caulobacteraceae bacterium]